MNKCNWSPSSRALKSSKMALFIDYINHNHNCSIDSYSKLHEWSVNNISSFWGSLSDFFNIKYSDKAECIFKSSNKIYKSEWFKGATLNYAENLLDKKSQNSAIESFNELGSTSSLSYHDLYNQVAVVSDILKKQGFKKGDRVAAMMPNVSETIISSLACASLGGVWSSCSPDFGDRAIIDRFKQINPKILIVCNGYTFKGKKYNTSNRIDGLILELKSVEFVIVLDCEDGDVIVSANHIKWSDIDFISNNTPKIIFEQMKFSDPLYIMFSSGTTGKPKSIVHSIGGTLIQHIKELGLHTDLQSSDRILYYTTCGWMMWNWVLSSLYFGSTLILYEGSPFYPNKDSLFQIVDKNNVNIFGTSAKYISYLQSQNIFLIDKLKLKNLRTILSTGSALTVDNFNYVHESINSEVQISSISGGTDLISCFALGNPILPVYEGELQCLGLGMDVASFNVNGEAVQNERGELVCRKPFPSMPVYFLNDNDGKKYFNSYFNKYENVWTHGDFIEINDDGGAVIYGRSDATLNPGGIRVGTSEIYSAIEGLEFLDDSIAVNLTNQDSYILFVKLNSKISINDKIISGIRKSIKGNLSPKHLPAYIFNVSDIPYTINGKKVEIAIKNIADGEPVENIDSISNQECLNEYSDIIDKRVRFKL